MSIFRAYDIRGVYKKDFDEKSFYRIGFEFARATRVKEIVVGNDARKSSPSLKRAFIEGVASAGCNVTDIGFVPTPLVYFSVAHYKKPGGAVVTASHNPPEYNGLKLVGRRGVTYYYENMIGRIERAVRRKVGVEKAAVFGKVSAVDVKPDYEKWILGKIKLANKLKVVIDCGNGIVGSIAPQVFKKTKCDVIELFCEIDPSFPNHIPDPGKEDNIRWLTEKVRRENADLGIAFDGDGDRVVFVDEGGRVIQGDVALALFAQDLLAEQKAKVIIEVKCSKALQEVIEEAGGLWMMSRTGHSYVHSALIREKAAIAGEMSGHYYFASNYGYDDAVYAALKMAEIVSRKGRLSKLVAKLPSYVSTPEYRIWYPEDRKFWVVRKIAGELRKRFGEKALTIDGVRLELPKAWGLLRASNTEPVLVVRFEGKTRDDLRMIRGVFEREFQRFNIALPSK